MSKFSTTSGTTPTTVSHGCNESWVARTRLPSASPSGAIRRAIVLLTIASFRSREPAVNVRPARTGMSIAEK